MLMLISRSFDVPDPKLIHQRWSDRHGMGDLPVLRFLNEENISEFGRVADCRALVFEFVSRPNTVPYFPSCWIDTDGVLIGDFVGRVRLRI